MDKEWELVRIFHERCGHPCPNTPTPIPIERLKDRIAWIFEEVDELQKAQDMPDQIDALIDIMYFTIGTLVEMGVKPDVFFNIVHETNIQKLLNADHQGSQTMSKVPKPENWTSPKQGIKEELLRIMNN